MSEVIYQPPTGHYCGPNEYGHWLEHWNDPEGTVRACSDCGRTYVAYRESQPRNGHYYMGVYWRRESRFERWRRERRQRREEFAAETAKWEQGKRRGGGYPATGVINPGEIKVPRGPAPGAMPRPVPPIPDEGNP